MSERLTASGCPGLQPSGHAGPEGPALHLGGGRPPRFIVGLVAIALAAAAVLGADAVQQSDRARIAWIYEAGETTGPIQIVHAVRNLPVDATVFASGSAGSPLTDDVDLGSFDLIVVDTTIVGLASLADRLEEAATRTQVVAIGDGPPIRGSADTTGHPWIDTYWANASQDNYARLTRYLLARVLGRPGGEVEPPIVYPDQAFHHPDAPALFATLEEYLDWYANRPATAAHRFDPAKLTVGVHLHLTSYQQKNLAHIEAIVRAIERRGHNVIALAARGGPALVDAFVRGDDPAIDVLLFSGERLDNRDLAAGREQARRLGVPVLGAVAHTSLSEEEFAASPGGLAPSMTARLVGSEQDGLIEPIVVGGRGAPSGDRWLTAPFAAEIEWRVDRALAWASLRRTPNADKRIVFTFWSQGGGKANVGADPDDFLDVPASLLVILERMRDLGYDIGGPLPNRETLARRMALEASNVGTWAPGELAARVERGDVHLIPEATYLAWFDALPADRRAEIVEMWGPPPGRVMVHTDAEGNRFLVVPGLTFGNVLVAPQPDWGYLQDTKALMSTGALPPHHQYLAFFLWLQQEWRADAWVSLFTNIVLQMGKSEGPAATDHIARMLGTLPHIHPERLGGSGGAANKRKGLAQTVSWYNLVAPSETSATLGELRALLARYADQADAERRAEVEAVIRQQLLETGVGRALEIDVAHEPVDQLVAATRDYLDEVERAHAPYGSKVLGDAPEGELLADMVTGMLGAGLRVALAPLSDTPAATAQRLTRAVLLDGRSPREAITSECGRSTPEAEAALMSAREYADRLREAPREIEGILAALSGQWIEPGPMDAPMRRPDAVPPGRSLYHFDQRAIPTVEAEAMGMHQADALIEAHREKHGGAYPTSLAFVLWTSEIAKTHGATEAQVLHLLGTRAVRNARGEVTGVELIPRDELGRPRVDVLVTTSGTYRDHYQDKIELIAQAIAIAAASPEPDNPVAASTRATEAALRAAGQDAGTAATLAQARVFAPAPGAYSPSIQFLAKSGDQRGDETRMADLFTNRMSHAYGAGLYGTAARQAFESNLSRMDAATLPRSSHVNGMLDHPMSAGFLGGLNLAAKAVTGDGVDLYVSNLRDPDNLSIESAARAIQTELRTRYFNPAWLTEMKNNGYEGARTMMYMTDHLDLWDSTATGTVSSADWAEVKSVYVDDSLGLDLDAFFDRHNPHAQQVVLANLMGAAERGHWEATDQELTQVASRLARSMRDHGAVCEASVCRNPALARAVETALEGAPDGADRAAAYTQAIARATTAPAMAINMVPAPAVAPAPDLSEAVPDPASATVDAPAREPALTATAPAAAPIVTGRVMETVGASAPDTPAGATDTRLWVLLSVAVLLIGAGWLRGARG